MIQVYCDGACSGNPGPGGWAFMIPALGVEKSGFVDNTTNNRMEITAVIKALEWLSSRYSSRADVEIITDSQYVVNTMTRSWKKNKNIDLWHMLDYLLSFNWQLTWTWVKGHADNQYNARCDELAVSEYKKHLLDMDSNKDVAIKLVDTNYSRIIALSPEQLAEWLYANADQLSILYGNRSGTCDSSKMLEWLKKSFR